MLEPLAGSRRLDNGTIYLEILDKDVAVATNEDNARKLYHLYKKDQVSEDDDDSDELRISVVRDNELETRVERDALREKMDAEFAAFMKGEKYDYVRDLRDSL